MQDSSAEPVLVVTTLMSEFDSSTAVFKKGAKSLFSLMAAGEKGAKLWRPDELAAIFHHQMAAPMLVDLGGFDARSAKQLSAVSEAKGLLLKSFSDLFRHPAPPLELVDMVKDFAKANMEHPESGLPDEIAAALYYTSIAVAWVRLGERISRLTPRDLQKGLRWGMEREWLDPEIKELLAQALEKARAEETGAGV